MSLLGEPFDSILNIIFSALSAIQELVIAVIEILGTVIEILYLIFDLFILFFSIVLDPYLLGSYIIGTGFYYAAFTATTKKELLTNLINYYKFVFEQLSIIGAWIYRAIIKIVTAIIDMI